ncbi:hypothetical protein LRS74_15615 [Streptomyces sp. LX-29]|uniref:hypothetical protein n=1 Tax=unclassified Streptomyces TaxID=2593676 RepID=UPI0011848366|nr:MULTISPECIES: hypothetical protein [unclassified Streptomyces]WFB08323.1 hypothetical protein LRS74_15615 [Streptomyces sp. LX-29]
MTYELPAVIADIADAEKQATRSELTRLDLGKATGPTRYEIAFTYDPEGKGLGVIARFGADTPVPIPAVGQTVHVYGHGPLTVRKVDTDYEVNEEHGGLYVAATVDVTLPDED